MSLRYAILGALATFGPQSGYDLQDYVARGPIYVWSAELSSIYRTLDKLESEALVSGERDTDSSRRRKTYTITQQGSMALQDWFQSEPELMQVRDPMLLRLFFGNLTSIGTLRKAVHHFRASMTALEGEYEQAQHELDGGREQHPQAAVFWQLTLDFGKEYTAMALRWCDHVLQTLDAIETHREDLLE
ncbi:MAG: PadR family transcriptional regulator [Chloroflexi bacterium]|nr:PadR family transcriptional regulator [Chloroflexota bacterium]